MQRTDRIEIYLLLSTCSVVYLVWMVRVQLHNNIIVGFCDGNHGSILNAKGSGVLDLSPVSTGKTTQTHLGPHLAPQRDALNVTLIG